MTTSARRFWNRATESGRDLPGLLLVVLLIALPMAWVIGYSLLYSLGGIGYLSKGWTLDYWRRAFPQDGIGASLLLSTTVAAVVTLLGSAVALCVLLIAPEMRHRRTLLALLCLPLATPVSVVAFFTLQLLANGGFFARLAFHAGLIRTPGDFPPLVNDRWCVGIVLAHLFTTVPMLTLYFSQLWTTARVDRYCELAESLGASRRTARLCVALPLLLRRGRSLIVLVFLWTLGSFEIPLLLGRQSPQMFSVMASRRAGVFDLTQRPAAFVLATVYFLLVSGLLMLSLRWRKSHD
jgi:putative spermidine/putrescine transport system permease protein